MPSSARRCSRRAPSFAQDAALGESLESLLDYARERHPELRAMRYEADAATQRDRIRPARFPDPMFKIELQNITNCGHRRAHRACLPAKVGTTKYTLLAAHPVLGQARSPARGGGGRCRCRPIGA